MAAHYPPLTEADAWLALLGAARGEASQVLIRKDEGWSTAEPWTGAGSQLLDLLLPVVQPSRDRPRVIGHLAQSLDGAIATSAGESQWISSDADLRHTHRLRALVDAVVVGNRTVLEDDPQLTVRRVEGPDALPVVLDPTCRLAGTALRLSEHPRRPLLLCAAGQERQVEGFDVVALPMKDGMLAPAAVLELLATRGVRRVLVEGGGVTVSHFLAAECVDRLHLVMAPVLVGGGRRSVVLPMAPRLANCPRPEVSLFQVGDDWLFDCRFQES